MKKYSVVAEYPKVSIITCVYNGEKYISKLLDSVLNMGYPNIEHIIVNDGSTDSTEDIVMKYAELYKNKENSNLYIKYIKQENMGLGGATNTGLKQITGEYWTWINCDDWYETQAFFEPIEMLVKKPSLDYVQMNGLCVDSLNSKNYKIVEQPNMKIFNNKRKLYISFCNSENFKYILYICKTSSFFRICPKKEIYPSRYTQDVQLCVCIFSQLNGSYIDKTSWFFYRTGNNYLQLIRNDLSQQFITIVEESINSLLISNKKKKSLLLLFFEERLRVAFKYEALKHHRKQLTGMLLRLLKYRTKISFSYWIFLDKKLLLYFIYGIL